MATGEEELRFALAMRGGVSLAVWIGGACAEIDRLRRASMAGADASARPAAPPDFWTQVLAHSGYGRVVVDVIAGASAGGLNGVLYAASQAYDFEYDEMRQIWLAVGGLQNLVRRAPTSEGDGPYFPSLLQGDEYFQLEVARNLLTLVQAASDRRAGAGRQAPTPAVDLQLSATLVEPIERPVPSPADEQLIERRYASGFHFRCSGLPWERADFPPLPRSADGSAPSHAEGRPAGDGPTIPPALARLALAARSTGSFPAAFEAAFLCSGRPDTFAADEPHNDDLGGVFLDRRNDGSGFYVSDGGILDNIPLSRALNAVAASPADGPTKRYLIYLQPGFANPSTKPSAATPSAAAQPPTAAVAQLVADQARRSTTSVLLGAAGARIGSETINADIAQLEAHNAAVLDAMAVRRATFAQLLSAPVSPDERPQERADSAPHDRLHERLHKRAVAELPTYRQHRAAQDARLIRQLLNDPIGTLGEDRFPATVAGQPISDALWRSPIAGWTAADRQHLLVDLGRLFAERAAGSGPMSTGVRPITRVTEVLLEWARFLERTNPAAGALKERLYRIRGVAEAFLERPRRLAWVASVAFRSRHEASPPTNGEPARGPMLADVHDAVEALCLVEQRTLTAIGSWIERGDDEQEDALRAGLVDIMRQVDRAASGTLTARSPEPGRGDLRETLLDRLASIGRELHDCAADSVRTPVPDGVEMAEVEPAELLHRVLVDAPPTRDTLVDLEVVCYPEFAAGLPGRRPVDFVRLSSANPTPLAPRFTALLAAAARLGWWWDRTTVVGEGVGDEGIGPSDQQGIHVNLKLAGNELANFSAFLLQHWRANDWMWGRLDAVPTLVDLVVRPDHLRRTFPTAAQASEFVRSQLARWAPADNGSATWNAMGDEVARQLGDLFAIDDGEELQKADISAVRRALVAARQWEILASELQAMKGGPTAGTSGPVGSWTADEVARYDIGAEELKGNAQWRHLVDRFTELGAAGAHATIWNLQNGSRLTVKVERRMARAITRAAPWLAQAAASRLLKPRERPPDDPGMANPVPAERPGRRRRAVLALLVAAVVVLAVLGIVMDKWAFLLGLLVGLAVVVPPGVLAFRYLRRILGKSPPEPLTRSTDDLPGGGGGQRAGARTH